VKSKSEKKPCATCPPTTKTDSHKRVQGSSPATTPSSPQKSQNPRKEVELLIQQVTDLVTNQPEKAAIILTSWLKNSNKKS
jgi:flagellar biosynthesis/type III secretory pathway M-ring protein FliF/YscJ